MLRQSWFRETTSSWRPIAIQCRIQHKWSTTCGKLQRRLCAWRSQLDRNSCIHSIPHKDSIGCRSLSLGPRCILPDSNTYQKSRQLRSHRNIHFQIRRMGEHGWNRMNNTIRRPPDRLRCVLHQGSFLSHNTLARWSTVRCGSTRIHLRSRNIHAQCSRSRHRLGVCTFSHRQLGNSRRWFCNLVCFRTRIGFSFHHSI